MVSAGTGTVPANLEATLDTMTDEDIDASLDGWLGQFTLTPHLPPSPAPHNMAIGPGMTTDREITVLDLDRERSTDQEQQGRDKQSSGLEGALIGLHITPPDLNDPAGSLKRFLEELKGLSDVARNMAQLTGQMEANNSADATQLCHFMTEGCKDEFTQHFEHQGQPDHSMLEMIQNWTRMHLIGGTCTLGTTFRSMEGAFWKMYLQMWQHQVEKEAQ